MAKDYIDEQVEYIREREAIENPSPETVKFVKDRMEAFEDILTPEEKKDLLPAQKVFLAVWLEDTTVPMAVIAKQLEIGYGTVIRWRSSNSHGFRDIMERHLMDSWLEAKYEASETMFSLMRSGDFRATKYVLDYSGYAPTQKIDAKVGTDIQINIVDEEQTIPNA